MHKHQTDALFDRLIRNICVRPVRPSLEKRLAVETERAAKFDSSATRPRKYKRVAPAWNKAVK